PGGQVSVQRLPTQASPSRQENPQEPQWRFDEVMSQPPPPHSIRPSGQPASQRPRLHTPPSPQALPQPPQCRGSEDTSTQASPQAVSPGAHEGPELSPGS